MVRGFPDAETLATCERFSRWLRQGGGLPIRGRPLAGGRSAGLDFEGHREYRPGDDLRHVDWPLYARLGTLCVRTFEDEGAGTLAVIVDASASMGLSSVVGSGGRTKLDQARRMAAALVFAGLRECHGVLLAVARDGGLETLWLNGGLSAFGAAVEWLGAARPKGSTHLASSLAGLSRVTARGDAVVLGDFLDGHGSHACEHALDTLVRSGWRADLVRIQHAGEWDVPPPGVGLRDPESAGMATAPRDTEALGAALRTYRDTWTRQALRRECVLVDVTAEEPLPLALTRFFDAVLGIRAHA